MLNKTNTQKLVTRCTRAREHLCRGIRGDENSAYKASSQKNLWLEWLPRLGVGLHTERPLVHFLVRAHAWASG